MRVRHDAGRQRDRLFACHAHCCVRHVAHGRGLLAGLPFALIEYHRKCTDYLDDVGQDAGLRLGRDVDPERLAPVLARLLTEGPRPAVAGEAVTAGAVRAFAEAPWCPEAGGGSPDISPGSR